MVLISELDYDPENPIPRSENEDSEQLYFEAENSSMAAEGYAEDEDAKDLRDRAMDLIVTLSMDERFDPFVPYLAVNYFDRCYNMTKNEPHSADLIAVSCITLASKMRDLNFSLPQFLTEKTHLVDYRTELVAMMEYRVLRELDWQLRPVLAPCYVQLFESKLKTPHGIGQEKIREILINMQYDIRFTKFRPSVITAATLLAACHFLYPSKIVHFVLKLFEVPILQKYHTAIEECMALIIFWCHGMNLTITSSVSENKPQPTLLVRAGAGAGAGAGAPHLQDNDSDDAASTLVKTGETEESEEESEDDQFSLCRTRQRARNLKIAANERKGKGVKIVESKESEEVSEVKQLSLRKTRQRTRDLKMAAANEREGKGVNIVERAKSEEESNNKQITLRWIRKRACDAKISADYKDKGKGVKIVESEKSEEESEDEQFGQRTWDEKIAPMGEEYGNNEQQTQGVVINEGPNKNNEQRDQGLVINKGKAAIAGQPFGGSLEPDADSDSSLGPEKLDMWSDSEYNGLRMTEESLERVRLLLQDNSGMDSETEKDLLKVASDGDKLKQRTRIDVIEEEPTREPESEAEEAAEEGSGSDLFTLDGICSYPDNPDKISEEGKEELQRVQLRKNTQEIADSGDCIPLINPSDGNDSEEEQNLEAAGNEGDRNRRSRARCDYCSGCTCSLL